MRAPRRITSIRATLLCASAFGGALVIAPSAHAQVGACGPASPAGIVSCSAEGGPYGSISYTGLTGGRTLVLEEAVVAANVEFTGSGALTVGALQARIETSADNVSGVRASSADGGAVTVNAGEIRTTGLNSDGVNAETRGTLTINAGTITTSGNGSRGIYARNTPNAASAGPASITSDTIATSGDGANGIDVSSLGDVSIRSGAVSTSGDTSVGMWVNSRSHLDLISDSITTTGQGSHGMWAVAISGATINSGSISTTGEGAYGLHFAGLGATLNSSSIVTRGVGAHGLHLSPSGGVFTSGLVHTYGSGAKGIVVDNQVLGEVTINSSSVITEGNGATGISFQEDRVLNPLGSETTGFALKLDGGDVTTLGDGARGIVAVAYGNLDVAAGAIATSGEESVGLQLRGANVSADVQSITTEGDYAAGADIFAGGDAALAFGSITTDGRGSDALALYSGAAAEIVVGTLQTTGDQADGIRAATMDDLFIEADTVRTSGGSAVGIHAMSEADAALRLGSVEATGSESAAVVLSAAEALTVDVARRLTSARDRAAELTGATITFNLAADGLVEGASDAILLTADTTSVVNNAGTIRSEYGYGIWSAQGAVILNNSGRFENGVFFGSQADVINNSGLFVVDRDSEFGGNEDVFNNQAGGVVRFAIADQPAQYSFLNLERFNNAGTIDLINGVAGDVLVLPGVLDNAAGSRIRLDVDLTGAAPMADRIEVGSLLGASVVQVQVNGAGPLGETGVTVIASGAPQTGEEFTVEAIGGGFLDYDLAFDAQTGGYQLVTALAMQAFEPTKVASGAQTLWRRGADVVSARLEELRTAAPAGTQVWSQAYSGRERVGGTNGVTTEQVDLSHEVRVEGFAAGADIVRPLAGGEATFGGALGMGRTRMRFTGNGDISVFESLSAGVYGQWRAGSFALAGLVKGDFHDMTYRWTSADVSDDSDGQTWGARVEAAWRFDGAEGFVEPTAALAWNTTNLGDIADRAGSVAFGDTESLAGKVGVRAGRRMAIPGGISLQPWGGLYLHREFDGDNVSTLTFGSNVVEVEDRGERTWGEFAMGADVQTASGLGGFVRLEAMGGDIDGYAGRIGLRFSW